MSTTRKRVVITGMGVLSSIGRNVPEFKEGLLAKKVGIKPSEKYGKYFTDAYASEIIGDVDYPGLDPELANDLDSIAKWAYKVGREALTDSNLLESPVLEEMGLMFGISAAGTEAFMPAMMGDPKDTNMKKIMYSGAYASCCPLVASLLKVGGGFELVATACTASPNAIGLAFDVIQNGKSNAMLAIGAEPLYIPTFAGFFALKAMSDGPCSPYSGTAGMSIGEGAGGVVLEEYEHAKARGATIYGEMLSYATGSDAYHETAPDPKGTGASFVMKSALKNAGLEAKDIEYVNAHGTGTEANDRAENTALRRVFEENPNLPVSSTKSYYGHNIGAAGIIEMISCLVTLPEKKILPTLNFKEARSYCDMNYVPNDFIDSDVNVFMKNNYAFGGNNCSIVASTKVESIPASTYEPQRVVITGAGTVSSLGLGLEKSLENLKAGQVVSDLERAKMVDTSEVQDNEAQEEFLKQNPDVAKSLKAMVVDEEGYMSYRYHKVAEFNARKILRNVDPRKLNSISLYAMVALEQAISDAGYKVSKNNRDAIGMIFGISKGPLSTVQRLVDSIRPDPNNVRTKEFANALMNSIATQCTIAKGIKGYNTTLATGYSASLGAVMQGYEVIRQNQHDFMVVGGSDEKPEHFSPPTSLDESAFNYSTKEDGYQVYGSNNSGYFNGEGAAVLFLESMNSAKERGAEIYAEIAGYGRTCDNIYFNGGANPGKAMGRAIEMALKEANVKPEEVDMICGSSWGTKYSNTSELDGIKQAFGDLSKTIPLTNFNGHFGFIEAAGGAMNMALALKCIRENTVYPIPNTKEFSSDEHMFVTGEPLKKEIKYALSLGISEGGNCYALLLKSAE